jgi:AmmeMemoRadiSam system protein A
MDRQTKGNPYVALARSAVVARVRDGRMLSVPEDVPEEMLNRRAGAFVTLYRNGRLRGCIGTIHPTRDSLAEEIISNAIASSTQDPRFPAVTLQELMDLEISVDVLGDPEPITSVDELDPLRFGVIVSCGYRRGLLLPNLDGIDTVEEQVDIARRKAGIDRHERYTLERFEVIRHKDN